MNNSVTRVILGSLLPSFYFGLFLMGTVIYQEGRHILFDDTLGLVVFLYFEIVMYILIPSIIFSVFIEIYNKKEYRHIYLYVGLCIVTLLGLSWSEDEKFTFLLFGFAGILTTISLNLLYKRRPKNAQ